jgi:lysyl-tRNA synthetase, class II
MAQPTPAPPRADPPGRVAATAVVVPGRAARRSDRVPRLAALLVWAAGVVNLVSALLPAEQARLRLLDELVPVAVSQGATVTTAGAGVGLLLLAGGLRRRQRVAWAATVALLAGSAVLHVVKGLDVEEALGEAFLAGLLAGQGTWFVARPGPREPRRLLWPALAVVGLTLGYGVVGLLVNRGDVVEDLSVAGLLGEVARMAVGLGAGLTVIGRFGRFFPASVAAVFWSGVLLVAARALAPALVRRAADSGLGAAVAASEDSLAYFALRDDRTVVRTGEALVSWRPVGTVALAAGDPLGPKGQWPGAVAAFLSEAAAQGRIAAVLGCGQEAASVYAAAGLITIYLGDEALLDLDRFTLQGRAMRIARQSWNRARRAGFSSMVCRSGELDTKSVAALGELSRRWRGAAAERGFSMALGRLFDPRDPTTMVVAARDGQGRLRGFLHLVPWDGDGASLDVMRRDRAAPSWLNDFLIVEAAQQLPNLGLRRLSLNFSFLRALLTAGEQPGAGLGARAARWLLRRLSGPFQIETLYRFNKKFNPSWHARYLAVEALEELPRVAIVALRAEGQLPSPWRLALWGSPAARQRQGKR